jgi:hypothetical protein
VKTPDTTSGEAPGPVPSGTIQFVQNFVPQLEAGLYQLTTNHKVGTSDGVIQEPQPYTTQRSFYVQGERFALNPAEIVSFFPPANQEGEYSNVLPHVVFMRKTLPWERPIGPGEENDSSMDRRTWLALLVIDQDDPPIPLVDRTLQDLQTTAQYQSYFDPSQFQQDLEPGQLPTTPCQTIDVPPDLFNQIAPTPDDLFFTAHAREITTDAKGPGGVKTGSYSVVIANRLPAKGKRSTVHLVSLENLQPYLPNEQNVGALTKPIRLVSLARWSFFSLDLPRSFTELVEALNQTPSNFQIPNPDPATGKTAPSDLAAALNMGYTAMTHTLREGTQTVSWYRGPLIPFNLSLTVTTPILSSDSVLRYDPVTGFFDTSYAAAWQLGQLLGLQNQKFAVALYNWKRENKMATIRAIEQTAIQQQYGATFTPPPTGLTENVILTQSMQFIKNNLKQPQPK